MFENVYNNFQNNFLDRADSNTDSAIVNLYNAGIKFVLEVLVSYEMWKEVFLIFSIPSCIDY